MLVAVAVPGVDDMYPLSSCSDRMLANSHRTKFLLLGNCFLGTYVLGRFSASYCYYEP